MTQRHELPRCCICRKPFPAKERFANVCPACEAKRAKKAKEGKK